MADRRPPPLPAAMSAHVSFLLGKAGHLALREVEGALEPLELRPRQFAVLSVAQDGPSQSQQQIAVALGIDRSDMVDLIDQLEARGLVERRRDPSDRRAYLVRLTGAGDAVLARARTAVAAAEETLLASVDGPTLRATLLQLLT